MLSEQPDGGNRGTIEPVFAGTDADGGQSAPSDEQPTKPARPATPRGATRTGRPTFFLGVGFTRCGTSWLHQQLTNHREVWVPPVKELHYWSRQRYWGKFHKYYTVHFRQMRSMSRYDVRKDSPKNQKRFDDYIEAHGKWALRYFLGWRGDRWYRSLFPSSGYAACGEITPSYIAMPERRIAALHRFDPQTRIIVLLRHPIERAWSMVAKARLRKAGDARDEVSDEVLREVCLEVGRTMQYWPLIANWQRAFGESQVHLGWYDDLVADKSAFLSQVARFLDIDDAPFRANPRVLEKRQNSVDYGSRQMWPTLRYEMAELLLPMTEALAEHTGGPPVLWANEMRELIADRG